MSLAAQRELKMKWYAQSDNADANTVGMRRLQLKRSHFINSERTAYLTVYCGLIGQRTQSHADHSYLFAQSHRCVSLSACDSHSQRRATDVIVERCKVNTVNYSHPVDIVEARVEYSMPFNLLLYDTALSCTERVRRVHKTPQYNGKSW